MLNILGPRSPSIGLLLAFNYAETFICLCLPAIPYKILWRGTNTLQ